MEGFRARAFSPMVATKMDPSYKVDEGYSEDTRSQDDTDSPMRMEPGGDDMLPAQTAFEAAMALNDGEKGGKQCQPVSTMFGLIADLTNLCRVSVQSPTYTQSLIYSLRRRPFMASLSQRSYHNLSCGDYVADLFLP